MNTHIRGKCPHCKAEYRLRSYASGRRARCRTCKQVFVVPGKRLGGSVEDNVVSWLGTRPEGDADKIEADDEDDDEDDGSERSPNPFLTSPPVEDSRSRPQAH